MDAEGPYSLSVENGQKEVSRLDVFLTGNEPSISRSAWQRLIRSGLVTVNGTISKPGRLLKTGDEVEWTFPKYNPSPAAAENVPLHILFEDASFIVLNKPAGLVVHPAAGNSSGTLLNGLLSYDPALYTLERAGIVHRLDKETSGVMVVAKSRSAMEVLQIQFKTRTTRKEYRALVRGTPPECGRIETPIGRHPIHRKKQAALNKGGRECISTFRRLEQFTETALINVKIETGRTHQIRVHMAHIGYPVIGDRLYGGRRHLRLPIMPKRQMLHAARLSFNHPKSGKRLFFETPLPDDMAQILEQLRIK